MWQSTLTCTGLFTPSNTALRTAAASEVFLSLLIYLITQVAHGFVHLKEDEQQAVYWDNDLWRDWFAISFAVHTTCIAICGLYSPLVAVVLGWIHFVTGSALVIYEGCGESTKIVRVAGIGMLAVINMLMLIVGMAVMRTDCQ